MYSMFIYVRFSLSTSLYLAVAVVDRRHAHHGDGGGGRRRILRLGDIVVLGVAAQLTVVVFSITTVPGQAKKS